jgi:hypothetical protein
MAFSPLPPLLFFFLLGFFLVLHPSSSSLSYPTMSFTSVQLRGVQASSYKREVLCLVSIGRCGNGRNCFHCSSFECNLCWTVVKGEAKVHACFLRRKTICVKWLSCCEGACVRGRGVPSERSTLILGPLLLQERPRIRVCAFAHLSPCASSMCPLSGLHCYHL